MQVAGQVQVEPLEEDSLVVAGLRDAAGADLVTIACGKHDVHHAQLTQFGQHPPRLIPQASALTELAQELPEHVCQEADQNVRPHTRSSF